MDLSLSLNRFLPTTSDKSNSNNAKDRKEARHMDGYTERCRYNRVVIAK